MPLEIAVNPDSWNPGLGNGHLCLADVYDSMPRDPESAVPWYVRLLENPKSPVALAGAVDLFGHDCIHVVLGRGLTSQDEAFVLGFTMGTSQRSADWQRALFGHCAARLYRGVYRFSDVDREVFDFAYHAAKGSGARDLAAANYRELLPRPLHEVRRSLGVDVDALVAFYAIERRRWSESAASLRLPRRTTERTWSVTRALA